MDAVELRPLAVGEVVDVAVNLYKRNATTLIRYAALIFIPIGVVSTLWQLSLLPPGAQVRDGALVVPTGEVVEPVDVALLLLIVVGILATIALAFRAASTAYLSGVPNATHAARAAVGRAVRVTAVVALITLPIALCGLLTVASAEFGAFVSVFVVPYLWIKFSAAIPAASYEDARALPALRRSRQLVKRRWWFTFTTLILATILIPGLFFLAVGLGIQFGVLIHVQSPGVLVILNGVAGLIVTMLTIPLQVAVIVVLYFDHRVRREAFDLQVLARGIGGRTIGASPLQPTHSERPIPRQV